MRSDALLAFLLAMNGRASRTERSLAVQRKKKVFTVTTASYLYGWRNSAQARGPSRSAGRYMHRDAAAEKVLSQWVPKCVTPCENAKLQADYSHLLPSDDVRQNLLDTGLNVVLN